MKPVARVADDRERVALVGGAARRLDDGDLRRDRSASACACRASSVVPALVRQRARVDGADFLQRDVHVAHVLGRDAVVRAERPLDGVEPPVLGRHVARRGGIAQRRPRAARSWRRASPILSARRAATSRCPRSRLLGPLVVAARHAVEHERRDVLGSLRRASRSSRYSSTVASEKPVHAFVSPCCLTLRGSFGQSASGGANAMLGRYSQSRRSTASGRTLRLCTVRLRASRRTGANVARPGGSAARRRSSLPPRLRLRARAAAPRRTSRRRPRSSSRSGSSRAAGPLYASANASQSFALQRRQVRRPRDEAREALQLLRRRPRAASRRTPRRRGSRSRRS